MIDISDSRAGFQKHMKQLVLCPEIIKQETEKLSKFTGTKRVEKQMRNLRLPHKLEHLVNFGGNV